MRPLVATLTASLTAIAFGGCLGGGDEKPTRVRGDTLTIYSSLPFQGVSAEAARAVAAGQELALEDAGGSVGGYRVRLVQLDSSQADDEGWDPGQVNANAERAVDDDTAIAYLGELDYGGSAVSLPVTNDAGLLQVSPGDGLTSLTRTAPGTPREGPERYYPSESRTFLRLVPNDLVLVDALLDQLQADGVERLAVVVDESIYGRELAGLVTKRARNRGLDPVEAVEDRDEPGEARALAEKLAEREPDAIVYSGTAGTTFARLLAALAPRLPLGSVWGAAGLSTAGVPPLAPERVAQVLPQRPAFEYPPSGRRVLRRIPGGRPEALYGYEAVRLVLDAVRRVGGDRRRVVEAVLSARPRDSVIGRYAPLPRGDVTENRFALRELRNGRFSFTGVIR